MIKNKGFKLTNKQKIAFGQQAIAQLNTLNSEVPAQMVVAEVGPTSIIFNATHSSALDDKTLVLIFESSGLACHANFIGRTNCDYSATLQPLYLSYMCETFGELFRTQAMGYWQQQTTEQRTKFESYRRQLQAELNVRLNHEEADLYSQQNNIFAALQGNENQKLTHLTTPQITPKQSDATVKEFPDRER